MIPVDKSACIQQPGFLGEVEEGFVKGIRIVSGNPSPAVREYCEQHGFSRFVREGGFDYLLRRWERIVRQVTEGYRGILPEFQNDMDARRIIHELLPLADDAERAKVESSVPALDALFFNATRPVESCIYKDQAAKYDPNRDWWYYRIPKDMSSVSDEDWQKSGSNSEQR